MCTQPSFNRSGQVSGHMRSLALWSVCPDTGPASFSGRSPLLCVSRPKKRCAICKQSVQSSLQQPGPPSDDNYRQQQAQRSQPKVASLTWPENWQDSELSADSEGTQQPTKSWDNGFFSPAQQSSRPKVLKINRDLLLVSTKLLHCHGRLHHKVLQLVTDVETAL